MLTGKTALSRILPPDRRRPVTGSSRAVGSFVPKLAAKAFEKYGFPSAEIITSWAAVAGADIARISAPERLKWPRSASSARDSADFDAAVGATLILRVDPAHALDVEYRAAEILDRINRHFGYRAVSTLKILQAPLPQPEPMNENLERRADIAAQPQADIEAIADAELRSALTTLWASVSSDVKSS